MRVRVREDPLPAEHVVAEVTDGQTAHDLRLGLGLGLGSRTLGRPRSRAEETREARRSQAMATRLRAVVMGGWVRASMPPCCGRVWPWMVVCGRACEAE